MFLLNFGPKSGYQLKKELRNSFGITVSYGTLYPHLHSLERSDLVAGTWSQEEDATLKRKNYDLTNDGRLALAGWVRSLAKISLGMQFMLTNVDLNARENSPNGEKEYALGMAEKFLSSQGYITTRPAFVKGTSGKEYFVDLLAVRPIPNQEQLERIMVRTQANASATIDDILKTVAISHDLQISRSIIMAVPSVQDEVMKLAEFNRILVYDGKNWSQAAVNLASHFDCN